MLKINQPANQIRLTNVAVVRLRQKGQRFEIACYPNKVRDWRAGIEKDVREVLQSHRIFVNVGKGEFARDVDLELCFGTNDVNNVSAIILNKGDVQLSAKERQLVRDGFVKEVCGLTAERLISIQTGLPLTPAMVENTAKQLRVLPKFKEGITSKAACARLISRLTTKLPQEIARALLRADIVYDPVIKDVGPRLIKVFGASIIEERECDTASRSNDKTKCLRVSFRVPTAEYQRLCDFVSETLGPNAELIVVSMLDRSVAVPPPPSAAGTTEKSTQESSSSESEEEASGQHDTSGEESQSDEELLSSSDGRPERNRKGLTFSALVSSEEDSDEEEEEEIGASASQKKEAATAQKRVDDLKALLEKDTLTLKSDNKHPRVRKEALDKDNWLRKQQRKKQERREKERDRKVAEEEAAAKQKAKEEEAQRRLEAERKREANATKMILHGGPGWCVDCQVNYVEELGQDLRQHYRMEWHTFNAKRRLRDKMPVSRREFDELSRDVREGFLAVTF